MKLKLGIFLMMFHLLQVLVYVSYCAARGAEMTEPARLVTALNGVLFLLWAAVMVHQWKRRSVQ